MAFVAAIVTASGCDNSSGTEPQLGDNFNMVVSPTALTVAPGGSGVVAMTATRATERDELGMIVIFQLVAPPGFSMTQSRCFSDGPKETWIDGGARYGRIAECLGTIAVAATVAANVYPVEITGTSLGVKPEMRATVTITVTGTSNAQR